VKDALKKFRFKKSTSNSAISGTFPPSTVVTELMESEDCQGEVDHAGWWEPGWYVDRGDCRGYVFRYTTRRSLIDRTTRERTSIRRPLLRNGELYYLMAVLLEADDRNTPMDESQTHSSWSIGKYTLDSFPHKLTNRAPSSSPTDLMTLHASMLSNFQQVVEVAKVCTSIPQWKLSW